MENRNVAIGLLVVFGVAVFLAIVIVSVAAALFFYSFDWEDMEGFEDPAILSELGVHVGDAPIQKTDAFENGTLTRITDIRVGDYLDRPGQEIAVVSSEGAVFTDLQWKTVHTVEFSRSLDHVDLVALPTAGEFRFINRASWSDDAAFIDADGNVIWEYGVMMGVNDMAAGDLDADGDLDFVVGANGSGGLHRVNIDGKRVWKKSGGNLWHAEIVDVDGAGTMRIVHSNAGGEMVIRDADGKQIRSSQPPEYFSSFSLCAWPDTDGIAYPFFAEEGTAYILDYDGSTILRLDTPDAGSLATAYGTPVRFVPGEQSYIACVVDYELSDGAILYVCDSTGTLVYQEVLPESCAAVAAVLREDGASEYLVVGGTRTVWAYEWGTVEPE